MCSRYQISAGGPSVNVAVGNSYLGSCKRECPAIALAVSLGAFALKRLRLRLALLFGRQITRGEREAALSVLCTYG